MFCGKCGFRNNHDSVFCGKCGFTLSGQTDENVPPQSPIQQHQQRYDLAHDNIGTAYAHTSNFEHQPDEKSLSTGAKIAIGAAAFTVVLAVVAIFVFFVNADTQQTLRVNELLEIAERYLLNGNYEQALIEFMRVIDIVPREPRGYTGAADSHLGLEQVDDAINILRRGLNRIPDESIAWAWINIDPRHVQSYFDVSDILIEADSIELAIEILRSGSQLTGNSEIISLLNSLLGTDNLSVESGVIQESLDIEIIQIDSSNFPIIRIFVDIRNSRGEVVDSLNLDQFDIYEIDSAGEFIPADIEVLRQLMDTDDLSINLVMDRSGSMADFNRMTQAQNAAVTFLNFLEGQGNSFVELTLFDSFVDVPDTFSRDFNSLRYNVLRQQPGGFTALYDAIYYALLSTHAQRGAKCVIVFTDGYENASVRTHDDVVQLVLATGIPLYIIGVGSDVDEFTLQRLAAQTGGMYFSSENTNLEEILQQVYYDIYIRQMDQYYIQLRSNLTNETDILRNIVIRTRDDSGFCGESQREFIPVADIEAPPIQEAPTSPHIDSNSLNDLQNTIFGTNDAVVISVTWENGRTTTFFRDGSSLVWGMVSRNGYTRISKPTFSINQGNVILGFATTLNHYVFEDNGTGVFGNEYFTWRITNNTSQIGSIRAAGNQTQNFYNAINSNNLFLINITRSNGQVMVCYRDDNGIWLVGVEGVGDSFRNIEVFKHYSGNDVIITVADMHEDFVLHQDGSGFIQNTNENIRWNFSYLNVG